MPRRPDVPCAGDCGKLLWRGKGCLPPGEAMCRSCRTVRYGKSRPAICAQCSQPFTSVKGGTGWPECCSRSCAGKRRWCESGIPPGGDPERARARWRRKNHQRRARRRAGFDEVTAEYELSLRTKAKRCPLCRVRMTDTPYLPTSKELDHIVPLNVGGTHTVGNVRIICRVCNRARPADGSDYCGQTTLWAERTWMYVPGNLSAQGICVDCTDPAVMDGRCEECWEEVNDGVEVSA